MRLTARQREVVALVRQGFTYAEIGARLGISPETVRVHVADVAAKCGVHRQPLRWLIANADKLSAA